MPSPLKSLRPLLKIIDSNKVSVLSRSKSSVNVKGQINIIHVEQVKGFATITVYMGEI